MLELRDRIRELGIYKAVGVTPRQAIAMVLTSTIAVGLVAGAVGVPAGIALHDYVIPVMGHAANTDIPFHVPTSTSSARPRRPCSCSAASQ